MPEIKLVQAVKNNSIMLANYMIDHATIAGQHFVYSEAEKMLYRFNGKIYEPFEGIDLDRFFHDFMVQYQVTETWKMGKLNEIERAMKVNSRIPRAVMDQYEDKICLLNGVLHLDDMSFHPHSPAYHFATMVDVPYEPEAGNEPEAFLSALERIFYRPSKKMPDYETIDMVKRIGGALILPKNKLRQLFLFLGEGANGKSMLINTFAMFFPREAITYMSLEELSGKGFEREKLLRSRFNISTEAKGGTIDAEEIKKIIYGEGISLHRKFKESVEFLPKTKIVVASNAKPYFNDTSFGLERRLTVVSFNNRFLLPEAYRKVVDPERYGIFLAEDDDVLMDKIRAERAAILNYFLAGLKELIDNNWQLNASAAANETKNEYLSANDTAGTWLRENYEVDTDCYSLVSEMLTEYRIWYRDNVSTKPLNYSVATLGSKIREIFRLSPVRYVRQGRKLTAYNLKQKYESAFGDPALDRALLGDGGGREVGALAQEKLLPDDGARVED